MDKLNSNNKQSWLGWFYRGLLFLGLMVLFGRLVDLQVIKGAYYRDLSEDNRIRRISITAPRGEIYARGGELLVANKEIKKKIIFDKDKGYSKTEFIEDAMPDEIVSEYVRDYKLGEAFAHISGVLGAAGIDEVQRVRSECIDKGVIASDAYVGRLGIEEEYECILSGENGEKLVEVDAGGETVRILGEKEPVKGNEIRTNIDYRLQKELPNIFSTDAKGDKVDYSGAVVVSDIKGQILAIYSAPSYNPNSFIEGNSDKINRIFDDKSLPLFNRALRGVYQPGSVYKPLISIAALEEFAIDKDFKFEDTGQIEIKTPYGDFTYRNWYLTQYGGVEGEIDLGRALARSTDTFFYKIGEHLGIDSIVDWSRKFGLGSKTGIDLPGEEAGLMPSPEWKKSTKGENWFLGNTYHLSIGQGDMGVTPLQMNKAIASIANGGLICEPKIVGSGDCEDLEISNENIDIVIDGMIQVCSEGGTGYTFFDSPIPVACKTGTAQTGNNDSTHAWFTFFAPASIGDFKDKDPEIVVTVLVENGGEGSKVAGPIARDIFDFWFDIKTDNTIIDQAATESIYESE